MSTPTRPGSPVRLEISSAEDQPTPSPQLEQLYAAFESEMLVPLWTEIGDLMPTEPQAQAVPHLWRWRDLLPMAARAGELVPIGRGGERRALALANPGLNGRPFATSTLWAAIQYLNPNEDAPVHRHTQNAFRFVVEGEGVWTVVNGDPVAMRRGDFLPQGGWHWHGHRNISDRPMAWIDGLDIPFSYATDATFFEFGPDEIEDTTTPDRSRSERLWGHPGLRPLTHLTPSPATPLLAYRWEHTDRALTEQLEIERDGHPATVTPGHAAVRFTNPTTGGDILRTLRAEFHRLAQGASTLARREVGSSVYQVFEGTGEVTVGTHRWEVSAGDLFVVPSWAPFHATTERGLDLFRFSDTPIFEHLNLQRTHDEGSSE